MDRYEIWSVMGMPVGFINIKQYDNIVELFLEGSKDFVKNYVKVINPQSAMSLEMKYTRTVPEQSEYIKQKELHGRPFMKYYRTMDLLNKSDSGWKII